MNYNDYAELRRRAEKRLTLISVWPLLMFQGTAYLLMVIRSPYDLGVPMLSFLGAAGIAGATWFIYRRRTAINRKARRTAIDEALEEAVEAGWPIEEPTPRDLRLLATLLDDDMEARAGMGRAVVWSSLVAVVLWVLTYVVAGTFMYRQLSGPFQIVYFFLFMVWLAMHGAFAFMHRGQSRQSAERVADALRRASGRLPVKRKRPAQAPWWNDDEDADPVKRKRAAAPDDWPAEIGDDGEITDDLDALRRLS